MGQRSISLVQYLVVSPLMKTLYQMILDSSTVSFILLGHIMPHLTASSSAIISFCSVAVVCIIREKWKSPKQQTSYDIISISQRGKSLLTPTLPYIIDYLKCLQDHCDPYTNPKVRSVYILCISYRSIAETYISLVVLFTVYAQYLIIL